MRSHKIQNTGHGGAPLQQDVALVLSSGGARGLAHIGAIEALERHHYRITSIAGCSMGSLIGGMYAAGRLEDFKNWMYDLDRSKMWKLTDLDFSLSHLMKGERVIEAMKDVVPDIDIQDLPIPYCAVATDWENGHEVVFRSGSLYEAIRASISMPAVFSPVRRDGMLLVDGGVCNPLPLNLVARREGDILVAVNVSGPDFEGQVRLRDLELERERQQEAEQARKRATQNLLRRHLPSLPTRASLLSHLLPDELGVNYINLVDRALSIAIKQNAEHALQIYRPDIIVDVPMAEYDGFDYDKAKEIAALGEKAMNEVISRR